MLKIYIADCTPLKDSILFERKMDLAGKERTERILSFQSNADQRRALAATLLLRESLEKEGIAYENCRFSKTGNGKPCLCGSGLYFNLSHAGERAMCVIADCEVGADIESLSRFVDFRERAGRIAKRCLTKEELEQVEAADDSSKELIRMWTRKESYVKLTGEGLACDFSKVDTLHQGFYEQRELADGYCATVCTKEVCGGAQWMETVTSIYA